MYVRLRTKWSTSRKNNAEARREELAGRPPSSDGQPPVATKYRKPAAPARPSTPPSPEETLTGQVKQFLEAGYEFRANQLNNMTEYRRKDTTEAFHLLGEREENSLCMEAHLKGILCWDRDIRRYVRSLRVPVYHPFRQYMNELPAWDGCDRVESLARRVSVSPLWVSGFHRWMRALAAQWMGMDGMHGNSVAPVLISRRQGRHKSTFCKLLLPDVLQAYYTDHYDLNSEGGAVQKLATFGLINLDELDKFSDRKMGLLKNVMQMADVNIRRARQHSYSALPRIASFIATSNHTDLLTDPTGSRRFLCVEVTEKIDVSPIHHAQLYAQLKSELLAGQPHWFSPEEEAAITRHNQSFHKTGPDTDLFHLHYRLPARGLQETASIQWLSAATIYETLRTRHPATMRQTTATHFGKTLIALGLERKHTRQGNLYRVIARDKDKGKLPATA